MEDTKPIGEKGSILGKIYKNEGVIIAETRGDALVKKARLNEAIKVVEQLEVEVADMVMPKRFSRTAKPSESEYSKGPITTFLLNLTEDEYKRHNLLLALSLIKNEINSAVVRIKDVVLDIEATKQE